MTNQNKVWTIFTVIIMLGVTMTFVVSKGINQATHRHDHDRFHALTDVLELELKKRLQQYEIGLHNFKGLFQASNHVDYDEFRVMSEAIDLDVSYPGALGVGFVQMVPDNIESLAAFRKSLLAEGAPEFQIHYPPNERYQSARYRLKQHLVIRHVQPYDRNKEALGLDIGAEANRRKAAEESYFHRKPMISDPIQLVQSSRSESGFLYMEPVFREPREGQEEEFLGWVYLPIVGQLAVEGISERVDNELKFEVYAGERIKAENLIGEGKQKKAEDDQGLSAVQSIDVGGQKWLLSMQPSQHYRFHRHWMESLVIPLGLALSLLGAFLAKSLVSQAGQAEALAKSMTKDLHRLAMVAKRTTNTVVLTDVAGRITWVNEAFTRMTGYSSEEAIGKSPGRLLQCEESDPRTIALIREQLASRQGFRGEIYNRHKDGHGYWVYLDIQPLHNEEGLHVGFLAIEYDVTERREAARKLEEETNRTRLALDSGRLAIWEWDVTTDKLILDERWEWIIGPYDYEAGKFNKYWEERIHPDDMPAYEQVLQGTITGDTVDGEWRYRNSNDQYVWVLVRGHVVERDGQGVPVRMNGTIMEISDRKKAEEALRVSEARSKAMFECSGEAIFLFNNEGFVEVNAKTVELFGFASKEEVLKHHPADLSPPLQANGISSEVAAKERIAEVQTRGLAKFEWMHQRCNGERFDAEVSLALLDGTEKLAMGIIRDVSQRKELERQLSQAQKLESIGQLAAGVAHEINTPMQCVFSNIEYLQDAFARVFDLTETYRHLDRTGWTEESQQMIEAVEKRSKFDRVRGNITEATAESGEAARRVIEIVRAMKTMSHPGTAEKVVSDLNKLVEDASIISRNRWKYVARLERHLADDLPGIPLLPAQMSQVMLNLIVNAADAIAEKLGDDPSVLGSIDVRTKLLSDGVLIEVQDSGNGMPERVKKRIFDPFYTTKEVGKGTGQGLAIAYDVIVNQHRGRIEVESEAGVGTTFSIWLPCPQIPAFKEEMEANLLEAAPKV